MFDGELAQDGIGIQLGVVAAGGQTEYAAGGITPDLQGLVIRDRNGMSARLVIGLIITLAGAMAQSGPKSVESRSYISGDYLITETKTTYYSEAEKAEMRQATSDSVQELFAAPYSDMELHVFSRDRFGRGNASGYHLNFFVGAGKPIAFETGFGFGKVTSVVDQAGTPTSVGWKYVGMPLRASSKLGPVRAALTYEWNWLKYGVQDDERVVHPGPDGMSTVTAVSHPWRLELSTVLARRVAIGGGVVARQIKKPEYGYVANLGILF